MEGNSEKQDERLNLEVDELHLKVNQMTPSEVNRKAAREVEDVVADNKLNIKIIEKGKHYSNAIMKYLEIEDKCYKRILNENKGSYIVKQNVAIEKDDIDIVALAKGDKSDLIYEVKYWAKVSSENLIANTIGSLCRKKESYERYMGRRAIPILMIVTSRDNIDVIRKLTNKVNKNKLVEIRIEDEFDLALCCS